MADNTVVDYRRKPATNRWTTASRPMQARMRIIRRMPILRQLTLLCGVAVLWGCAPATALATPVAEFPEVVQPATAESPATLTPTAQRVIEDGRALVGDPAAPDAAREARGVRGLKSTLTRGRFLPTATRALGAVGLASLFAYEVCKADALQCWLFEREQQLAPAPTTWKLSPYLVEFKLENGQDGVRNWNANTGEHYEPFSPVSADGRGGGSASWSGDPDCHPNCYPKELQGVGPLEYAVTWWGGAWDTNLWWLPVHGPASVDTFSSVEMGGYSVYGPNYDPLSMIYRPLISTQTITPMTSDDPNVPNAQAGVTVPDAPDWAEQTAQQLLDDANRDALELLARRVTALLTRLPTCLGLTFEACESGLRDAGLTGTIRHETLSQDDAIMEEDAERVTAISPGGTVLRTDEITVYVNPATMPTMSGVEQTVANQITARNPDVDPDPESGQARVPAKTVARRCIKAVRASGVASVTELDCARLPIFITGYDAVGPAATNLQAIIQKRRWALLHRRIADQNTPTERGWYDRVSIAPPTCLKDARTEFTAKHGYRGACHEYPFYSTSEGYKGALNDGTLPNLRLVNPDQNTLEGDALDWFYGGTGFRNGPFRWPKCNIPAIPDSSISLLPEPLALGAAMESTFIAVPIGSMSVGIRTMGLCNGRT